MGGWCVNVHTTDATNGACVRSGKRAEKSAAAPYVRVSGVVCGDACVPGFECGLARESVGGVGFEVGL